MSPSSAKAFESLNGLIAYAANVGGVNQIFVVNPDGSEVRQITYPPNGWRDNVPAWSPDGTAITFERFKKDPTRFFLNKLAGQTGQIKPAATVAADTRGGSHSLEAYRGQWVVLEWVNHSCPYTKKHYKAVDGGPGNTQAMQRDYANRVVWLSVVSSAPGKQGFTTAEEADQLTQEKSAVPSSNACAISGNPALSVSSPTTFFHQAVLRVPPGQ